MEKIPSTAVPYPQLPKGLSCEEIRVLRECERESLYYRCAPFSAIAMGGVVYAGKYGFLGANSFWAVVIKVMAAGFAGFAFGKLTYRQQCLEKLMKLPNSDLGESIKRMQAKGILHLIHESAKDKDSRTRKMKSDEKSDHISESTDGISGESGDAQNNGVSTDDFFIPEVIKYIKRAQLPTSPEPVGQKKGKYGDEWDE
uniref:OCIA domain-containing protein n=1 Tax=Strigamia maritima TaxID=126957 RepID=T1ITZ0_STRMM